jgi:hypothetical protein
VEAQDEGRVQAVKVTYNLTSISASTFIDINYAVYFNGAARIDYNLRTDTNTQVYRIGVDMRMPGGYENIEWLTRGPQENLNDRLTGAFVGRYNTTVSGNFWNYEDPQDNGTHEETRWMAATNFSGAGLLVVATGDKLFEANALHYDWRSLASQRHLYQIQPTAYTILGVNYGSRGTGGASCGPATLSQYQLSTGSLSYSFTLYPLAASEKSAVDDIALLYRDDFQYEITDYAIQDVALADKALTATFAVGTNSLGLESAQVIAAVYDSEHVLVSVSQKAVAITGPGYYVNAFDLEAPLEEGQTLSVYAWTTDSKPICAPVTLGA